MNDGEIAVNGEGHERTLDCHSCDSVGVEEQNARVGSVQPPDFEVVQKKVDREKHTANGDAPEDVENQGIVRSSKTTDTQNGGQVYQNEKKSYDVEAVLQNGEGADHAQHDRENRRLLESSSRG